VPGQISLPTSLSEKRFKISRDYVSFKLDEKVLNEIFILRDMIPKEIPKVQSEATRIM
jgi:hypothetical protein